MEIRQIALEIAQLVEKKNHDYDNSFDKTMDKYGDTAYFLRIEDKLNRLINLSKKQAVSPYLSIVLSNELS